jgi:urease accessory protein
MKRSASISTRTTILALGVFAPSLAFAHSGGDHVGGFLSGLEHPLAGLDHLLAMVAVGVSAARTTGRGGVYLPVLFVSAMVAGAMLGMVGIGLPYLETGIALSVVTFGVMVGLTKPLPLALAMAVATLFGFFHGNAHGLEIPESVSGVSYAAGFVASTAMLHAASALSALKLAPPAADIPRRWHRHLGDRHGPGDTDDLICRVAKGWFWWARRAASIRPESMA